MIWLLMARERPLSSQMRVAQCRCQTSLVKYTPAPLYTTIALGAYMDRLGTELVAKRECLHQSLGSMVPLVSASRRTQYGRCLVIWKVLSIGPIKFIAAQRLLFAPD